MASTEIVESIRLLHQRLERVEGFMDYIRKGKEMLTSSSITFDSVRDMVHSLDRDLVIDRPNMCIQFSYRGRHYTVCVNESSHRATLSGPVNTYSFDNLSKLKHQIELDAETLAP